MAKGGSKTNSSGGGGNITWSGPRMKPSGKIVRVTADHGGGRRPITRGEVQNKTTSTGGALVNAVRSGFRPSAINNYNERFARERGHPSYASYREARHGNMPTYTGNDDDNDTSRLAKTMAKAQVQPPQQPSWGGYQWNPQDERQRLLGLLGMRTQSGHSWGYSPGLLMALAGLGLFGR